MPTTRSPIRTRRKQSSPSSNPTPPDISRYEVVTATIPEKVVKNFLKIQKADVPASSQPSSAPKPLRSVTMKNNKDREIVLTVDSADETNLIDVSIETSDCTKAPPVEIPKCEVSASAIYDYSSYVSVVTSLATYIARVLDTSSSTTCKEKSAIKGALQEINTSTSKLASVLSVPPSRRTSVPPSEGQSTDNLKLELISTVREEIQKLREELAPKIITPTSNSPSFASIAAKPVPKKTALTAQTKPAIIVKATDESKNPQNILDEWKKAVSFRNKKYAPVKIQAVSNGKVRVEFDDSTQCQDTIKRTKDVPGFDAEEAKLRPPLLIIKGISKMIKRDELLDIIHDQNSVSGSRLCFLTTNRSDKLYNAVIETSPDCRRTLISQGKVFIEHQRVHVEDYSRFVQCYKCLQFGHTSAKCTSNIHPCAHCGCPEHSISKCPNAQDVSKRLCYNCARFNTKTDSSTDTNHSATNHKVCPRIRTIKARIDSRTDYGQ